MAALQEYVDPDATGAGNGNSPTDAYTALTTWESTEQQDLTDGGGDTMTCTCLASSGTADTTIIGINGWTTGAANYVLVEAASGDEAVASGWDAARYRLEITDSFGIQIADDYVRLKGLQIYIKYVAANNKYCVQYVSIGVANDLRIEKCRLRGFGSQNYGGIYTADADAKVTVWNTIIHDASTYGIYFDGSTLDVYNSVVYGDNSQMGINRVAGTVTVINTAVLNTTNDFNGTMTIDHCASDDNDGTNNVAESGGGAAWPDDFVDAANGDFTLKSGSGLVGGGIDDPGSGLYSDDINGDARTSPWDVGADEYIAAGPSEVFHENRLTVIDKGMKPQTAAGMGGVLVGLLKAA